MIVKFRLRFHTRYGQSLWLAGRHAALCQGSGRRCLPLRYVDSEFWQADIELSECDIQDANLDYDYVLREEDGSQVFDWGRDRGFNPAAFMGVDELLIIDSWNSAGARENAYYTKPFKQVLLDNNLTPTEARARKHKAEELVTHVFRVKAPLLAMGQTLCLLGNCSVLGNWNTTGPILLKRNQAEDWLSAGVDLSGAAFPIEYKYGVYDIEHGAFVRYEDGNNRILRDTVAPKKCTVVNNGFAALPLDKWRGAGVAIPVFSLRSEKSFGVGEFADLKLLADWCKRVGLKLIQLLPINDTTATHTWRDSFPYSSISAFALHPIYLNLSRVVSERNQMLLAALEPHRKQLNALESLDYEAVMKAKLEFLERIYPSQRLATFRTSGFQEFFLRNQGWLLPYAIFCYLRDKYGTANFNLWPEHRQYRPEAIMEMLGLRESATGAPPAYTAQSRTLLEHLMDEPVNPADVPQGTKVSVMIGFYCFIQYHLRLQLCEAVDYAHAQGVVLKGDLPIGICRLGADAWQQPELFHMDLQAGAPPDAFAEKGQNWGFPTYNWPRMKDTGYAWWQGRFEQFGHYFDALRIDHILGFFRIWSIPVNSVEGVMGWFEPAVPVHLDEFNHCGIHFNRERFLQPYITDEVLRDIFGGGSSGEASQRIERVKQEFLKWNSSGNLSIRPEFATQCNVKEHFEALRPSEENKHIEQGLYDLISNVLLFEAEGSQGNGFHFRFGMESTSSFKALDKQTQTQFKELYIDYFYHRQDKFWAREAMQTLPALQRSTDLLVCGEDLGMVPACVPGVMRELGLLSLEVQRMPKMSGRVFFNPKDAHYLSVVTPSTHDMSTIRGWWKEDARLIQRFYNQELGRPGDAPPDCEPWINQAVVEQHLASPAMWSIFQLQDLLGMDERLRYPRPEEERINIPSDPKHRWHYRIHLTLESLLQAQVFNQRLQKLVRQNGR
jgi:4-alpha-glucanotransferase